MFAELLCRTLIPFANFHHYRWKSLIAQIGDQKGCFHPCVRENMSVLHSSHVYPRLGKLPTLQNRFSSELNKHKSRMFEHSKKPEACSQINKMMNWETRKDPHARHNIQPYNSIKNSHWTPSKKSIVYCATDI